MSDYFDRVERELRLAAARRVAAVPRNRGTRPTIGGVAAGVAAGVATALLIAIFALTLRHHAAQPGGSSHHAQPDLSVQWHIGPTLDELLANFAVFRRPPTAAERAEAERFVGQTTRRPEIPEYVRLLGTVDGTRVYFMIFPVFRHGATGLVVAHQMSVSANDLGMSYVPGSYLIFPNLIGGFGQPTAFFSVVPDGVRAVRWSFACPSGSHRAGCVLPPKRVAYVPVRDNLAVLPVPALNTGTSYASPRTVTWYRVDGARTLFTNPNAAVPFPGAPPWPGVHNTKRPHDR